LCHNCGACLHACQYAPPHEFGVNVPQAMARVRLQTYGNFAWPPALGELYRHNGLTLALALAGSLALFLIVVFAVYLNDSVKGISSTGNFYALIPHGAMVFLFAPVFLFVLVALTMGVRRFWHEITPAIPAPRAAVAEAVQDALRLKYLDGGHGEGCNNEDDRWTLWRRRFHHATFYGFALCFAATAVATLYHYVSGLPAPYNLPSLPKLLGAVGGLSMVAGTSGLFWLHLRRHPQQGAAEQSPMDLGFIALLLTVSLSGLALWLLRSSALMPFLLAIHLGSVMALFLTMPYSKFAHGFYRSAALLKWAIEKRLPNRLQLGND
jgi:citrate/tricarballylate utilization protein